MGEFDSLVSDSRKPISSLMDDVVSFLTYEVLSLILKLMQAHLT